MNSPRELHVADTHANGAGGNNVFNEHEVIHRLKHYLPAQSPLKDFIHHNTLHGFQNQKFEDGIRNASEIFGYKVSLQLDEYRAAFKKGQIRPDILDRVISAHADMTSSQDWHHRMVDKTYDQNYKPLVGRLRNVWRTTYHMDMDTEVHPLLFRILCSYLDQGVSIWDFPAQETTFLGSIRALERNSFFQSFSYETCT